MAFHDEVKKEIEAGRIPVVFTINDLLNLPKSEDNKYKIGDSEFSENAIRAIPYNHSISKDGKTKGDYVAKGRAPQFYRLGKGTFTLIDDTELKKFSETDSKIEQTDNSSKESIEDLAQIDAVRELVAKNNLKEALRKLVDRFKDRNEENNRNMTINLQARLQSLEAAKISGIISFDEIVREENIIRNSILGTISK